ncbi:MAG: myo-inosose-2 dehydratase [Clostridiaceae bacterium]|nr:myo-inosose-2 dehydratase [Clostridiaceae bacterium]
MYKFNSEEVHLGIAPIGWTNDDLPDLGSENTFEQCVSEMALAGFTGSEVGNKYPKDPEVLKPMLDVRGIRIANQWFSSLLMSEPYEVTIENFKKQLDFLEAMGAKVIGASEQGNSIQGKDIPVLNDQKPVLTDEEWDLLAKGCNEMGKIAYDRGMTFTYHHHMGTCVQTIEETERFLEMTDPELVFLLYDTGHFYFSGEDPVEALEKFLPRVRHVHLKDVRADVLKEVKAQKMSFLDAVRAGAFTVPGDGHIDFDPVFKLLSENNYKGWMIVEAEQDPAKANPFVYAKKARQFIREKTGL